MNIEQALQTFLAESRDLLVDMEEILLLLEENPEDAELYNALFRCVHTIKGSAGMFGLNHVVDFSHVVENLLDRLRQREILLSQELVQLLLASRDHIGELVELTELDDASPLRAAGAQLLDALRGFCDPVSRHAPSSEPVALSSPERWHISVRFDPEVLRHGMDPLGFIQYLGNLGTIESVVTLQDYLPALDALDAERCYLGFDIDLVTSATRMEIEQVFEFVRDLCQLEILPPHSDVQTCLQMMLSLPEEPARLGEILVACGALTEEKLAACLQLQADSKAPPPRQPIGEVLVKQGLIAPELVDAALDKQSQTRDQKSSQYLRVHADKLDQLINLVGEMVIASAAVSLNAVRSCDTVARESATAMQMLVEEVRDCTLSLRMVPVGEMFQRMQRIARDVARERGKDIELIISGAESELDKTMVEKISDPLVHLVRNACDHGIETGEVRLARGKSARGTLRLNAFHESGGIVIEVIDDGSGLDRERIAKKAIQRGLISADANLSDQEINNLIFEPGLSTADKVTNLSGRGVGMDVVRRNIEALRGTVDVFSETGQGTRLRMRLPLTLAIIDGFLSSINDEAYVVPLDMVEECIEFAPGNRIGDDAGNLLNLRGRILPLIRLREHFGIGGTPPRRQNVLVVHYGGERAGLIVDELMGEHQTVIKPLNEMFARVGGISGSTILGNGRVALILDVPGLIQLAQQHQSGLIQECHAESESRPALH